MVAGFPCWVVAFGVLRWGQRHWNLIKQACSALGVVDSGKRARRAHVKLILEREASERLSQADEHARAGDRRVVAIATAKKPNVHYTGGIQHRNQAFVVTVVCVLPWRFDTSAPFRSERRWLVANVTFEGSASFLQTRQHTRLHAQRLHVLASLCQVPWVLCDFTSLLGADLLSKCVAESLEESLRPVAQAIQIARFEYPGLIGKIIERRKS